MTLTSILLSISAITVIILFYKPFIQVAFADSPSFALQELRDRPFDLINMSECPKQKNNCAEIPAGDRPFDIVAVTYFSNGKVLNATFWFTYYFNESSFRNTDVVTYGMYIDADSNQGTGLKGIDYEIEYRRENGLWNMTLYQYSSAGPKRVLPELPFNLNFEKDGNGKYIQLAGDLQLMGFPSKYRVMFYAQNGTNSNPPWNMDFSSWVNIPPPQLSLLTTPNTLVLRPEERKIIGGQLTSDIGPVPEVLNFIVNSNPTGIKVNVNPTVQQPTSLDRSKPASFEIIIPKNTTVGKYSIPVLANISKESNILSIPGYLNTGYGLEEVNLILTIIEPLTALDYVYNFWNTWNSLISFIVGLGIGQKIWPILSVKIKSKLKKVKK
jgi:hypothetical protein